MAAMCGACGKAPKALPLHRCVRCLELKLPVDEQILLAYKRRDVGLLFFTTARKSVPSTEWPEGERWCAGCFSFRRFNQGSIILEVNRGASRCRVCETIARRYKTYGLTRELDEKLGTRCNICGCAQRRQALAVDHCHKTGRIRGKLCDRCNHLLLGGGQDSLQYLQSAVSYLTSPPAWG